jgi:hypothetical protein
VAPFRSAGHHLRLVDRLADTRVFWRDELAARERLAKLETPRGVIGAHAALAEQVEALEDLVLEAWSRPGQDGDALVGEVEAARAAFADLEWAIAGLERPVTDEVTVWFAGADRESPHDQRTMEELIVAYGRIAARRGWKLRVALRWTLAWEPEEAGPSAMAREVTHWHVHPDEVADDHALQKVLRGLSGRSVVELRITGRHSATMLLDEGGLHALEVGSEVRDVLIVTWPGAGDPTAHRMRLLRPPFSNRRQRQILPRRDRLRDYALGRQSGIGRLDEALESLLRDRMLAAMFPG